MHAEASQKIAHFLLVSITGGSCITHRLCFASLIELSICSQPYPDPCEARAPSESSSLKQDAQPWGSGSDDQACAS